MATDIQLGSGWRIPEPETSLLSSVPNASHEFTAVHVYTVLISRIILRFLVPDQITS